MIVKFTQTIGNSRLLNDFEKQALLDGAGDLPEDLMVQMVRLLEAFDRRSLAREKEVIDHLKRAFGRYQEYINAIHELSDIKRQQYHRKGEILLQAILAKVKS